MKFFNDVLSQKTIDLYFSHARRDSYRWKVSNICWSENIRFSSDGSVYMSEVTPLLYESVMKDVEKFLPKCKEYQIQQYLWDKNSSIACHNDFTYNFGATIYLNKNWHINYGGLFLYDENEKWNVYIPEFNTMVLTDRKQMHLVTEVSSNAPDFRYTLQIWGKN